MKKVIALLAVLTLASCRYVAETAPATPPASPPAEEPARAPEPNYVYALDASGAIIEAESWGGTCAALYNAVSLDVDMHIMLYLADP